MALRMRLKSKTKMSVPQKFGDQVYLYQMISNRKIQFLIKIP